MAHAQRNDHIEYGVRRAGTRIDQRRSSQIQVGAASESGRAQNATKKRNAAGRRASPGN